MTNIFEEEANDIVTDRSCLTDEQQARIRKFVAALRSGAYEQGQGQLRLNGKFCCLGVACDVYAQDHEDPTVKWDGPMFFAGQSNSEYALPRAVQVWYGFTVADPKLTHLSAAACNDSCGYGFAEIAECFEGRYLSGESDNG